MVESPTLRTVLKKDQFNLMDIEILKSKVHRAVITEANLHYIGSLTLDENLMEAANMIEYEKIQVVNVNTGSRIETYLIKGKRGSGVCCLNGPAARLGAAGDIVIIISYARMDFEQAKTFQPWVVFPKEGNTL
jgi:aspartate 1-decarboxylase